MESSNFDGLSEFLKLIQPGRILILIVGLVALSLLAKVVRRTAEKLHEAIPARRLLILQVSTMLNFCVYIIGGMTFIYVSLRPPKELMLAVAGSAAVAVGFALKDLMASLLSGIILLFDRPFQVGDRVAFDGAYGEIVGIGLRTVRLNTLDDSLVTIPNVKFLTDAVSSGNSGALDMMIEVNFNVAASSNLRKAQDLLKEVVITSKYAYLAKPVSIVLTEKSDARNFIAIEIKVKAYVIDVRYEKSFQSDIVLRGNELLQKNDIQRPSVAPRIETPETP